MVNFPDPQVDIISSPHVYTTIVKFWHAVGGLYIWEFFTTLDYEWKVIRRRLPYRWTIWIYFFARFTILLSIILFFVTFDVTAPINCQLWMLFAILFLCLSSTAASLLIVIRTIAIWNRNKVAVALAMIIWGTSIGFHLHNIILVDFKWIPSEQACHSARGNPSGLNFIPAVVSDMVLLLFILAGVFVLPRHGDGTYGLIGLLWKQGIIWLVLGFVAEIPSVVFTLVPSNDSLHVVLFQVPSQTVMIIAATRMHRSLIDFTSRSTEVAHENPPLSSLMFWKTRTKQSDIIPTTLNQIRVSVNRNSEHHSTGSTGSKNDGDSSTGTVFSTSKRIHQVMDDSSNLGLTQSFAHSLPTISTTPVHQAESV